MKEIIIISKGQEHICLVDNEDFDLVKGYSWYLNYGYIRSYVRGSSPPKQILMHRLILGILNNPEIQTDHRNHNRLDNRKSNLRQCTHSENQKNKTAYGKSEYLGVTIENKKNHYKYIRAQIRINGKRTYLGRFKTEMEAAMAYDEAAKIHHKEFANLNFK